EFSRNALEVMRQPLEEGSITIARAAGTVTYPARFMLVASMNPCPCGYRGSRTNDCRCDDATVAKYVAKLSGPLLDRIDLHVTVARVSFEEMVGGEAVESSATIRRRVEAARDRQRQRLLPFDIACNAEIGAADVRCICGLDGGSMELLHAAMTRGSVSARAFDRIARVARTIADLDGADQIGRTHLAEALLYRSIDRTLSTRP
ncbi:MAG: ATP-binding protein, partial [Candidatus Velthaea sp.]